VGRTVPSTKGGCIKLSYSQNAQVPYLQSQVPNPHRVETPPNDRLPAVATVSLIVGSLLMLVVLVNLVCADAFLIHLLESK